MNWERGHHIPILCFLEYAVMEMYFVFGFFHQSTDDSFFSNPSVSLDDDTRFYATTIPIYRKGSFASMAVMCS
jgi:hypothetical protein